MKSDARGLRPEVRSHNVFYLFVVCFVLFVVSPLIAGSVAPPERRTVQTDRPAAIDREVQAGESVNWDYLYISYGDPWDISDATEVLMRYRSTDMTNYYVVTGSVVNATNGHIRIPWTPACEGHTNKYAYQIACKATDDTMLRVWGKIKIKDDGVILSGSSGTNPVARTLIDWAATEQEHPEDSGFLQESVFDADGDGVVDIGATDPAVLTNLEEGAGIDVSGTGRERTIAHEDTSSQVSVTNADGTVLATVTLDQFGHISNITTKDLDGRYYTEAEIDALMAATSNAVSAEIDSDVAAASNILAAAYAAADAALSNALTIAYVGADTSLSNALTIAFAQADTSVSNALTLAFTGADTSLSNALTIAYAAADTALSNALTTAYQNADTSLSNALTVAFAAADTIVSNALVSAYQAADSALDATQFDRDGSDTMQGPILPDVANAYDLGSAGAWWRSVYVGTGTVWFVDADSNIVAGIRADGSGTVAVASSPTGTWHRLSTTGDVANVQTQVTANDDDITALQSAGSGSTDPWTIIVIPDSQNAVATYPAVWTNQCEWIRDNVTNLNVKAIIHTGDLVQSATTPEWQTVTNGIGIIEQSGIPVFLTVGNHDYDNGDVDLIGKTRVSTEFNSYFPISRYTNLVEYYETNKADNVAVTFSAEGQDWLWIGLEFGPRTGVVSWVDGVLSNYPNRKVIISQHDYLNADDTPSAVGDDYNAETYAGLLGDEHTGQEMWDQAYSKHDNIRMIVSSHFLDDGIGQRWDFTDQGTVINQMLANYQTGVTGSISGGEGQTRVLTVYPSGVVHTRTYNPEQATWASDYDNNFSVYPWPDYHGVMYAKQIYFHDGSSITNSTNAPSADPDYVVHVDFDGNTATDDVGGHTVNEYNGITIVSDEATFDGSADYMLIPDAADLEATGSWSVCARVNLDNFDSLDEWACIAGKGGSSEDVSDNHNYAIIYDNDVFGTGTSLGALYENAAGANTYTLWTGAATGVWYNLIAVHDADADTLTLWANGTNVAENAAATDTPNSGCSAPVVIGTANDDCIDCGSSGLLDGQLDNFRIYTRALSTGEIATVTSEMAGE